MKRILILAAALALGTTAAFGQIAITAQGAYYGDKDVDTPESIFERFQYGEGLFYGAGIEVLMDKFAIGASANFSFYNQNLFDTVYIPMMDYDIMAYAAFHVLGSKAFLDPFVEAGLGYMAQDYAAKEYEGYPLDPDPNNPLLASTYVFAGAGVGINLGSIGAFVKATYNFPMGDPIMAETEYYYLDGTQYEYELNPYPISNLKVSLGVKFIF